MISEFVSHRISSFSCQSTSNVVLAANQDLLRITPREGAGRRTYVLAVSLVRVVYLSMCLLSPPLALAMVQPKRALYIVMGGSLLYGEIYQGCYNFTTRCFEIYSLITIPSLQFPPCCA